MRVDRRRDQQGFTLVEVLVALVVAALLSAILIDGAGQARARNERAEQRRTAVLLARSQLTRATAAAFDPIPRAGTIEHLHWALNEASLISDAQGSYALIAYEVAVSDGGGHRLVRVTTRRLKALRPS